MSNESLNLGHLFGLPTIKVVRVNPDAAIPTLAHEGDAGLDLQTMESVTIPPGKRVKLPSGLAFGLPDYTVGRIWPRSKLANHKGLVVLAGVCDRPYTGEVMISLLNTGEDPIELRKGDKVAQMAVLPILTGLPIEEVDSLEETSRGASGINDAELRLRN